MTMISAIFTTIGSVITAFAGILGNGFTSLISLFYDGTNGVTDLGILMLIGTGVGLVYFGWKLIKALFQVRRA